jgi:DivIVA domain-containing protein
MTESRLAPEEIRTRTFTRVVRGYRRKEVRRLLERAAADLARLRNGLPASGPDDLPPLTSQEVEEARFQPALGGYEMDEVDEFLDQLVVELERAARDPLRPSSALPAPTRQAAFPAAGLGPASGRVPAPVPVLGPALGPAPAPGPDPGRALGPGSQPPGSPPRPAEPRPPAAGPLPPAAGPLPTAPPPPAARSRAPGVAPPAREPAPDEGFFPPESVPPSAAPAPPPPAPPLATRPPPPTRPLTPSEVETRTFERGAPGYLPNHVDLFLARAARALAGRDGETLSRWDVLRQRFPLGPRGYAASEVDAFLVRLAAQFPDPDPAAQREILRRLEDR